MLYTLESIPRLYPVTVAQVADAVVTGQLRLAAFCDRGRPEVSVYGMADWLFQRNRTR